MEVTYSCDFFAVSDSLVYPNKETGWCHVGIIEHFEIWPKIGEIDPKIDFRIKRPNLRRFVTADDASHKFLHQ